ncbi:glycosyltransferase family 4 protein [Desulfoplanes formicivorans]|uniref:Glycosyl transferase group 1 n=1 Tax=Desulfoplanes formicivorans TaxID=1592317 RepID=A0A194AE15_9BACT|nr:glycosyltransferase family 4 protein [Desulfoplanes formicivorans]GAU07371.1 glycosyl transferase group 1 [Desulfoplanes formicivorans]
MDANRELKIVMIHWGLIPGGVSKYAKSIENIDKYNKIQSTTIIINNEKWIFDSRFSDGVNHSLIMIKGRWDATWVKKLRDMVKKEKPDCIFIFGFNGGLAAFLATIGLNIPILASWHGSYYPSSCMQKIRAPFVEIIERVIYKYVVKHVIAVSKYAAHMLEEKGIPQQKITIIHNGISNDLTTYAKSEKNENIISFNQHRVMVGTCCRLSEQKGLKWFLDAIALVKKKDPTVKFIIWGDGPQKQELKKKSIELQIDDVLEFPGYVKDINTCLAKLDIFVMSSYVEYFSIALLEAMRAGLAILATDAGGNPEAVRHGKEGLLTPVDAPQEFADSLLRLVNSKSLRNELGKNAQRRFENTFTEDQMIQKTADWFLKSINDIA